MNIKKAVKENLALKISSILISILLWFYVFYVFGAKTTKTAQIQIQTEGLNISYQVTLSQPNINVVFSAPIQLIEQVEKNIRASMDLSNIGPGVWEKKPKLVFPKEVEIISIDPSTIQVTVENIITRDFKIKPTIKGKLQSGTILGEVTLSPDTISLQGTESILKTVKSVGIDIDITNAIADLNGFAEVKIQDNKGELIENITINTKAVKFHIPVISSDITKTVPIVPRFIGLTPYFIQSFTIHPQMITLRGNVADLEKINSIATVDIDLNQIKESESQEIDIILPPGIKRENPSEKITIDIKTEEMLTKTFNNLKIFIKNSTFKNIVLSQESCNVIIYGPKSIISSITTISVFADLKSASRGNNEIILSTSEISQRILVQITPQKIDVKILD